MASWCRLHRIQVSPRVRVIVEVFEPGLDDVSTTTDHLAAQSKTLASLGRMLRRLIEKGKADG